MEKVKAFCKRKNIEISVKRYLIDALGAMAQGLFASLLIGTIISTLGTQLNIPILVTCWNLRESGSRTGHGDRNRICTAGSAFSTVFTCGSRCGGK